MNKWFKSLILNGFSGVKKSFFLENLKGYDQQRLYAYIKYLSFWFKKNTKYLEWHWNFLIKIKNGLIKKL